MDNSEFTGWLQTVLDAFKKLRLIADKELAVGLGAELTRLACESYRSLSAERQAEFRTAMKANGYPLSLAKTTRPCCAKAAAGRLLLELTVLCANDDGVDYRDELLAMGGYWIRAERYGADPRPIFQKAAECACTEPNHRGGYETLKETIQTYESSACLAEMKRNPASVKPDLP